MKAPTSRWFFILFFIMGSASSAQAQVTYDLRTDWSDVLNPNGVWTYSQGIVPSPLPSGTWSSDFTPQTAWVGSFPTVWMRTQSTAGFDVQVGDIVTHSSTTTGFTTSTVIWTSPATGTVDIDGGVWMIRDIGRFTHWELSKNIFGTFFSDGFFSSGAPYNRANPFNLDNGTGGTLDSIPINAGDKISLSFLVGGQFGDYDGVNLSITLTAVPEPSVLVLVNMGLGAGAVFIYRRRKNRVW